MTQTVQATAAETASIDLVQAECGEALPASNLAGLLDQFTREITGASTHSVGAFAATVQSLHGELHLLAHQFVARSQVQDLDELDFDDIFPGHTNIPAELDPAYHGIMAAEELEHHCRELSRVA